MRQLTYAKNGDLEEVLRGDETLLGLVDHETAEAQGAQHNAEAEEGLEQHHRVQTLVLRRLSPDARVKRLCSLPPGVVSQALLIGHRSLNKMEFTFLIRGQELRVTPIYLLHTLRFATWSIFAG